MATHSSILAWRIQWTEEMAGWSPWGDRESDKTAHCNKEKVLSVNSFFKIYLVSIGG